MCIAAYVKPGLKDAVKEYQLRNCFSNNSDGAGFIIPKPGNVSVYKGFFKEDDFVKAIMPFIESNEHGIVFHCRIATHGATDKKNCHPHRDGHGAAYVHNGILSCVRDDPARQVSDSIIFGRDVLNCLPADWYLNGCIKWLVESAIGRQNKIVYVSESGVVTILNESEGVEENGVWYSNKSFNYRKGGYVVRGGDYSDYGCWGGEYGYGQKSFCSSDKEATQGVKETAQGDRSNTEGGGDKTKGAASKESLVVERLIPLKVTSKPDANTCTSERIECEGKIYEKHYACTECKNGVWTNQYPYWSFVDWAKRATPARKHKLDISAFSVGTKVTDCEGQRWEVRLNEAGKKYWYALYDADTKQGTCNEIPKGMNWTARRKAKKLTPKLQPVCKQCYHNLSDEEEYACDELNLEEYYCSDCSHMLECDAANQYVNLWCARREELERCLGTI